MDKPGKRISLREALEQASYFLHRHHMGAVYAPDGETLIYCWDVTKIVDDALSAPQRNCDRFASDDEARKAFIDWYNTEYDVKGDKWYEIDSADLKHDVDGILQDYIKWLFDPAEGKDALNG